MRYQQLFDGDLKPLGSYFDDLFAEEDRKVFFRILTQNIVPIIYEAKENRSFLLEVEDQRTTYEEEYSVVIERLNDHLDKAIFFLCKKLEEGRYLSSTPIEKFAVTRHQLFKDAHVLSPIVKEKLDWFADLCHMVADLDRVDLVNEYAEIQFFDKMVCHIKGIRESMDCAFEDDCKGCLVKKSTITSFTFSDDIQQLYALEDQFTWDKVVDIFVVLEYLQLAVLCYDNSQAILQREDFGPSMPERILKMNYHALYEEMSVIKGDRFISSAAETIFLFTVKRFKPYCRLLVNALLAYQVKEKNRNGIDSLELSLEQQKLYLKVKLSSSDKVDSYLAYKLCDYSVPEQYLRKSLESIGELVDISDFKKGKKGIGSYSISKCWDRLKLPESLLRLFFEQKSTHVTVCKANPVILKGVSSVDHASLIEDISKLRRVE